MRQSNRRTFLRQSGLSLAGATLAVAGASSRALGANERINLGVIGLSRGQSLCGAFAAQDDARLAYVCDTDRQRLEKVQKRFNADKAVVDLREILRRGSCDAPQSLRYALHRPRMKHRNVPAAALSLHRRIAR